MFYLCVLWCQREERCRRRRKRRRKGRWGTARRRRRRRRRRGWRKGRYKTNYANGNSAIIQILCLKRPQMAHLLFSACPLMNNYKPSPAKLHPFPALPPTLLHPHGTHTAHEAPTNNRPTSPFDLRLSVGVNPSRSTSIPHQGSG